MIEYWENSKISKFRFKNRINCLLQPEEGVENLTSQYLSQFLLDFRSE